MFNQPFPTPFRLQANFAGNLSAFARHYIGICFLAKNTRLSSQKLSFGTEKYWERLVKACGITVEDSGKACGKLLIFSQSIVLIRGGMENYVSYTRCYTHRIRSVIPSLFHLLQAQFSTLSPRSITITIKNI